MRRSALEGRVIELERRVIELSGLLGEQRGEAAAYRDMYRSVLRLMSESESLSDGLFLSLRLVRDMAVHDGCEGVRAVAEAGVARYEHAVGVSRSL